MSDPRTSNETLSFTQRIRRTWASKLVEGDKFPADPKDAKVLVNILADMDKQELTLLKIASDEGSNDTTRQMVELIGELFSDPRTKQFNAQALPAELKPAIVEELPEVELVPGELGALGAVENFAGFTNRMGNPEDDPHSTAE